MWRTRISVQIRVNQSIIEIFLTCETTGRVSVCQETQPPEPRLASETEHVQASAPSSAPPLNMFGWGGLASSKLGLRLC